MQLLKPNPLTRFSLNSRIPGQLVVQYTDHCNAGCPQCGMNRGQKFTRHTLGVSKTEKLLDAAAEKGIAAVSFTGGEPFLFLDELCHLISYAGKLGIKYIRTGTNGFLFTGSEKNDFYERISRLADQLANTPIRNIWVSIDSFNPQTHEQIRGLPGVVQGIEKALPVFAERGLHLSANLGINRLFAGSQSKEELDYHDFLNGFDRFYRYVRELGFSIANVCYPMWTDPNQQESAAVYTATSSEKLVYFSHKEKLAMFQALFDSIPLHRKNLRIFTPRSSLHALMNQYRGKQELSSPCRGGIDFFFIDSQDGMTYPCGYRGDDPLGRLDKIKIGELGSRDDCRRCDWECFRDPSELFSPLLDVRTRPKRLLKRLRQDPRFYKLWCEDLIYYHRCNYFNGRIPGSL